MANTFIGLDLGQTTDYSALTVLEVTQDPGSQAIYSLRHFRRYTLGTPYPEIVSSVSRLCSNPRFDGRATLVVDQTGVGRPVVDMFRRFPMSATVTPITITSGHGSSFGSDGSLHVPKRDIVNTLRLILETGRLRIARKLPSVEILVRELLDFQARITPSANEVFGANGNGKHDDLVLALSLPVWVPAKAYSAHAGTSSSWTRLTR
jgi:hypothetical protein